MITPEERARLRALLREDGGYPWGRDAYEAAKNAAIENFRPLLDALDEAERDRDRAKATSVQMALVAVREITAQRDAAGARAHALAVDLLAMEAQRDKERAARGRLAVQLKVMEQDAEARAATARERVKVLEEIHREARWFSAHVYPPDVWEPADLPIEYDAGTIDHPNTLDVGSHHSKRMNWWLAAGRCQHRPIDQIGRAICCCGAIWLDDGQGWRGGTGRAPGKESK